MIKSKFAGIQYMGEGGITQECLDAILRLIQYDDRLLKVKILSSAGKHCLLLTIHPNDLVAIKSGFTSGYKGEGPRKFSYLLQLLKAHEIEIDEYEVNDSFISRIDQSALTKKDIKKINSIKPVRPQRIYDYIDFEHYQSSKDGLLWKGFRPVIPFSIIDGRIIDLAITFWNNPDDKLMTGYRRLEDVIRKKTNIKIHGSKLFSEAFLGSKAKLKWGNIESGEQVARANLFISAYSAYRNPRAHREIKGHANELLSEFLLMNHLYLLESTAVDVFI